MKNEIGIKNLSFKFSRLSLLELVIFLLVSFLLASTLDTAKFEFFFSVCLLSIAIKQNPRLVINNYNLTLAFLFIWGCLALYSYVDINNVDKATHNRLIERIGLYFGQFFFAIAIYSYLSFKSYSYIKNVIFFGAAMNMIAGVIEIIKLGFSGGIDRMSFLSYEPSMAAVFYAAFFFFILTNSVQNKSINFLSKSYLFFGLMIRSKAQFVSIAFVYILSRALRGIKSFLLIAALLFLFYAFSNEILNSLIYYLSGPGKNSIQSQLFSHLTDLQYVLKNDIFSLIYFNELGKPSWVVRLSAIHMSFYSLFDNFFGLGWGGFNHYFPQKINELGYLLLTQDVLSNGVISSEVNEIFSGAQEATPKSYVLEILISTGFFGVLALVALFINFIKHYRTHKFVVISFFSLFCVAFFVESVSILALLSTLIVLLKKKVSDD